MRPKPDSSASKLLCVLQAVLSRVAKPSQVLKMILGEAVQQTAADRGVFVEVTGSGDLAFRVLYRFERDELSGTAGRFSRGVFSRVLATGEPVVLSNALDDSSFSGNQSVQNLRLVSILCMPIKVSDEIAALVHLERNQVGHFRPQHVELLESLLAVAGTALGALRAGEGVIRERDELMQAEGRARVELEESRELLSSDWSFGRFVGRSPAVRKLEGSLMKAARTDFPVLLLGETGTGKSILARVLHHAGSRSKQAMATVFCPSLEKGMVETELFGHKKGAFTGAVADRQGKVQVADGGTLFLDEIGDLPLDIQPKLLRLLQEKTYERVGDAAEQRADVRVIAATNRDLEAEVRAGRFRRDLYERLNYVPIRVPPLRDRREDLPLLLRHCLDRDAAGRWVEIAPQVATFLRDLDFNWPGNVRHIEQLAVRLAMEASEGPVTAGLVRELLGEAATPATPGAPEAPGAAERAAVDIEAGLPSLLAQEERKWIETAMRRYPELTRAELAEKLKISESALYKKLRLYNL